MLRESKEFAQTTHLLSGRIGFKARSIQKSPALELR